MTFTSATDLAKVKDPEIPTTVTYNPTPQGMAEALSGRATVRVCRALQLAAHGLGILSGVFTLWIAASVANDALTLLLLASFGVLCVLALTMLPSVMAHIHHGTDSAAARLAWLSILLVYAYSGVWLTFQPAHDGVLTFGEADPARGRQLVTVAAVFGALLAGGLNRFALRGMMEGYQLWGGGWQAPAPALVSVTLPEVDTPAGMTPEQLFASWFAVNVKLNKDGKLRSRDALESYRALAARLGYPAMSDTGFFRLLAAEAATTGGKVFSGHSNGSVWSGWVLEPFTVADIAGASPLPDRPE